MKFLIGENFMSQWERASYRGGIGLYYNDTLGGVLTFIVVGAIALLAIIGLFTVLGFIFHGKRKKKETAGQKWLKTGKM